MRHVSLALATALWFFSLSPLKLHAQSPPAATNPSTSLHVGSFNNRPVGFLATAQGGQITLAQGKGTFSGDTLRAWTPAVLAVSPTVTQITIVSADGISAVWVRGEVGQRTRREDLTEAWGRHVVLRRTNGRLEPIAQAHLLPAR